MGKTSKKMARLKNFSRKLMFVLKKQAGIAF